MRLLILGGNAFLGRATARAALAAGDDVTCAARGQAGEMPADARFIRIDRDEPASYAAVFTAGAAYDAVVDVSSRPSHVRGALAALADHADHWAYVSSGSVYTNEATPGQQVAGAPIHEPAPPEVDDPAGNDYANYGRCKVACERAVLDTVGVDRAFLCRPGLIIGPEDRSDRFTYWPERLARGGEVVAPGTPDDPVQWIDVRDLGQWLASAARERISGTYDAIGMPVPRGQFLADVAAAVAVAEPKLTWVPDAFLVEQGVNPWAGLTSLPMWLPGPEYAGFMAHDTSAALRAGLMTRPIADSAHAVLAWVRDGRPGIPGGATSTDRKAGLTLGQEAKVLVAWQAAGR